jgi:hypothetical protein
LSIIEQLLESASKEVVGGVQVRRGCRSASEEVVGRVSVVRKKKLLAESASRRKDLLAESASETGYCLSQRRKEVLAGQRRKEGC